MDRPTGVAVLAVFDFIGAACLLLVGIALIVGVGFVGLATREPGPAALIAGIGAFSGITVLIIAAVAALLGWGLWTLKNWARVVSIVLSALGAVGSVMGVVFMTGMHYGPFGWGWSLIRLGLNVLIVWYLLQPHVKQAFRASW